MLNKLQLLWLKINRWHLVFTLLLIVEMGCLPGKLVGFHCNDPALSHIYVGDTVSWKWLLAVASLLPLPIMLIVERIYNNNEVTAERTKQRALRWFKEFYFAFVLNLTIVETVKKLYGSPRPHFFDTCEPQEASTCKGSEFVSKYTCTKSSWTIQSDGSFPSGHTSLAMYSALFITYYLHRRSKSTVYIQGVQLLCMVSAVLIGVSRMMDHRHHWWDVLAGSVWGVCVFLYSITWLCRNFECIDAKIDTLTESSETNGFNSNRGSGTLSDDISSSR